MNNSINEYFNNQTYYKPALKFNSNGTLLSFNEIIKKLKGKCKVYEKTNSGKINNINTKESNIILEYNAMLEAQINKLLKEPYNNYKLQVLSTRYRNEIELLEKRIELIKNMKTNPKINGFKLIALLNQLKTSKERLKIIEQKIEKYSDNKKLGGLNNKIVLIQRKILEKKQEGYIPTSISKLQIYKVGNDDKIDLLTSIIKLKRYNGFSKAIINAKNFILGNFQVIK